MSYETLNLQDAIDKFHQLMKPDSEFRMLRLVGESKMGKSHLLTKIFPALGRQNYQAYCAVLDLDRNKIRTIPDCLHAACAQLHEVDFRTYYAAHEKWLNQPRVIVKGLMLLLSFIGISAKHSTEDGWHMARHLTAQFVTDLRNARDVRSLLLVDSVEGADESTRAWLMGTLLVQLLPLAHLRVVVAGRSLPEASGSYAATCCSYELRPVQDEEEYIDYCLRIGAELPEQSIRHFALAVDYIPGLFVELVYPTFVKQGASNG